MVAVGVGSVEGFDATPLEFVALQFFRSRLSDRFFGTRIPRDAWPEIFQSEDSNLADASMMRGLATGPTRVVRGVRR